MSDGGLPRIGIVGLGIMGQAYARNLRAAGFEVVGFDVSTSACAQLHDLGGRVAADARAVAEGVDHVLTVLASGTVLESVIAELAPALRPGMIVAEMGTLPIDAKERARDVVAGQGASMLDCPVSGTGAQAAAADLVVFASGDAADVATLRPAFDAIARDVRHVGDFGAGMKLKYVANLLVSVHNLAAAEALLLAERSGLDLQTTFDAITAGAGTSRMLEVRGPMMIADTYEPATMKMDVYMKDVMLILEHAREAQCPVPLMAASLPYYSAGLAQGRGGQDTAALFAILRQLSQNRSDTG